MTFRRSTALLAAGLGAAIATAGTAHAQEPIECRKVVFSDVGWTDISATTALLSTPPDRNAPSGTSATMRSVTAARIR